MHCAGTCWAISSRLRAASKPTCRRSKPAHAASSVSPLVLVLAVASVNSLSLTPCNRFFVISPAVHCFNLARDYKQASVIIGTCNNSSCLITTMHIYSTIHLRRFSGRVQRRRADRPSHHARRHAVLEDPRLGRPPHSQAVRVSALAVRTSAFWP